MSSHLLPSSTTTGLNSSIRHVWYQSQIEVVVDILVKRVRADHLRCDVQPESFKVIFRTPDSVQRTFGFDQLRHEIIPSKSTIQVLPTRIEIRLRKKETGIKWMSIEAKLDFVDEQAKAAQEAYIEELNDQNSNCTDPIRVQIMSDLNLQFHLRPLNGGGSGPGYEVFDFPAAAPNLALLGNIGIAAQPGLFDFFHKQLKRFERVFFVMGTNEGYNSTYNRSHLSYWGMTFQDAARDKVDMFERWLHERRLEGEKLGEFVFLHRTRYDVNNRVTILGCTLWSYIPTSHAAELMRADLNDFKRVQDWTPEDYRSAHMADVDWLNDTTRHIRETEPHRQIAIFSHHGPTTRGTLKPENENNELSCAFVTEMSLHPCWARPLKMWAFGHTQRCVDFLKDGVRVVSNQRGNEGFEAAKSGFQMAKVVTI